MSYADGSIWQGETRSGKKVWFVEVRIGTKANGKPLFTRRQAATRSGAIKLRQDLNAKKNLGQLTQRSGITVAEYGRFFVREVKPNKVKTHTATNYEWLLTKYVNPWLGKKKVADLQYQEIIAWINNLLAEGYGTSTVNAARAILGQVCKQACREQILGTNPVLLTDKVKRQIGEKSQVRDHWSKEEATHALKVSVGTQMDLFLHLCLYLGLRHGEALGLTWKAIDFEKRTIEIKFTLKDERRITKTGEGVVRLRLQEPKTKSSVRTLVISKTIADALNRHQMMQSVRKITAGTKWQESGMVFTTSIGTGVSQANNLKRFKDFVVTNHLRYIRIHDLRHTFGSLALESGTPLEQVSQVMGHADIGITKKIYAPDVRGFNEKAILAMESYLNPEPEATLVSLANSEHITPEEPRITQPVPFSSRIKSTQLSYKRQI